MLVIATASAAYADPMNQIQDISAHLSRAVDLAAANVGDGGRPFGAVLVRDGVVLAETVNTTHQDQDPSAHAELVAIRAACRSSKSLRLEGAIVYASGEPCPMCQSLAINVGVSEMYYALAAEDAQHEGWPFTSRAIELQQKWRSATGGFARHQEIAGAAEPFRLAAARG